MDATEAEVVVHRESDVEPEESKEEAKRDEDTTEDKESDSHNVLKKMSKSVSAVDLRSATSHFESFVAASTLKSILRSFRSLCASLRLQTSGQFDVFYPRLKSHLRSWQAKDFWAKLDKRASMKIYEQTRSKQICSNQRILVIGAGPCGLRTAIELQLMGAKVVVLEKRDRFSRNNVLHLWPYTIHDLKALGAKKFFGKFCAGSIDHISIRQLQCILVKVCLLLGVQIFENIDFQGLKEPQDDQSGWKAEVSPHDHPVSHYEFDVLIGADGRRNTLQGFKRKELRCKLAIAITANFINRHTEAESRVEEISGVAFIFNQKFFKDMYEAKGIGLENIVYYKDETHYFVMTAKKQSLLEKGVLLNNEFDTSKLLAAENIAQEKLIDYAREAADFATNYQLPRLEFAVNHYGKPDVAMFDFTSMYQADNSCRVIERHGHRLVVCLVGDSLVEPFWPMGTGCARGFFGGFDACWLIRSLCTGKQSLLECLAEREAIYRILAQTTPENTHKNFAAYTIDPRTRYPNIYSKAVLPHQVMHLVDTDNPNIMEEELQLLRHPSPSTAVNISKSRRRKEPVINSESVLEWFRKQLASYECIAINDLIFSFQDGLALCALIHRYRPELIDFAALDPSAREENLKLALDTLEGEFGLLRTMSTSDFARNPDELTVMSYLVQIVHCFRKELPAVSNRKLLHKSYSEEDDSLFKHNHPTKQHRRRHYYDYSDKDKSGSRNIKKSIAELVAKDLMMARKMKKRRSKHNSKDDLLDDHGQDDDEEQRELSLPEDKENIRETAKLNLSAHRKRVQRLLAQQDHPQSSSRFRRDAVGRSSIKTQERFQIIEAQFTGQKQRRLSQSNSSNTANKKPKDLKRAIGKLDKDDWQIRNIKQKMSKDGQSGSTGADESVKGKVPKWSKAAFQDKMNIMKEKLESKKKLDNKVHNHKMDNDGTKLGGDVEATVTRLQNKLQRKREKEQAGNLDPHKQDTMDSKTEKSDIRNNNNSCKVIKTASGGSDCLFCGKRVYLVERMSAEGKFFHRSCFRCDYCNSLLRIGGYVYQRLGPFQGKFFCIPHGTERSLERHRQYKCKAEEREQMELQRQQLLSRRTNSSNPTTKDSKEQKLKALPKTQVDRLMAKDERETTPERAEFEVSFNGADEDSNIMDEDEWTSRNFGQTESLEEKNGNNTNKKEGTSATKKTEDTEDDSVSNLDSDESDDDQLFHDSLEPLVFESNPDDRHENEYGNSNGGRLTAEETRRLQAEWMRRLEHSYHEFKNNEKISESSDVFVSDDDEDEEYYSSSSMYSLDDSSTDDSDSSADESEADDDQPERPQQHSTTLKSPNRKARRTRSKSKQPTNYKERQSSGGSTSALSALSASSLSSSSQFASDTATECQFTDSEGKPNPFNNTDSSRPSSPFDSRPKKKDEHATKKRLELVSIADRYQYKTPNLSERMRKEQQPTTITDFSTRRALNLKKNWVSHHQGPTGIPLGSTMSKSTTSSTVANPPTAIATTATISLPTTTASTAGVAEPKPKRIDSQRMDERLKSLMDRLSSQQKLLKPAEKPSSEMQHFLTNTSIQTNNTSSTANAFGSRDTTTANTIVKSPPIKDNNNLFKFLPSPPKAYQSINDGSSIKELSSSNNQGMNTPSNADSKGQLETTTETLGVDPTNLKIKDGKSVADSTTHEAMKKNKDLHVQLESGDKGKSQCEGVDDQERETKSEENSSTSYPTMASTVEFSKASMLDTNELLSIEDSKSKLDADHGIQQISQGVVKGDHQANDDTDATMISPIASRCLESSFVEENCEKDVDKQVKINADVHGVEGPKGVSEPLFTSSPMVIDFIDDNDDHDDKSDCKSNIVKDGDHDANKDKIVKNDRLSATSCPSSKPSLPEDAFTELYREKNEKERLQRSRELQQQQGNLVADLILARRTKSPHRTNRRLVRQDAQQSTTPRLLNEAPIDSIKDSEQRAEDHREINQQRAGRENESENINNNAVEFNYTEGSVPSTTATATTTSATTSASNQHASRKVAFIRTLSGMLSRSSSSLTGLTMRPRTSTAAVDASEDRKQQQQQRFKFTFPRSQSVHRVDANEVSHETRKGDVVNIYSDDNHDNQEKNDVDEEKEKERNFSGSLKLSMPPIELKGQDVLKNLAQRSTIDKAEGKREDNGKRNDNGDGSATDNGDCSATDEEQQCNSTLSTRLLLKKDLPRESYCRMRGSSGVRSTVAARHRRNRARSLQLAFDTLEIDRKGLEQSMGDRKTSLTWLKLLLKKNELMFRERELRVQATQLYVEERTSSLESDLREYLLLDARSPENFKREEEIVQQLVQMANQREQLKSLLEHDRQLFQMATEAIDRRLKGTETK